MEDTRRHIADTPDMLPALVQVMMVVMMMMRMHTTITAANPPSSTTPPQSIPSNSSPLLFIIIDTINDPPLSPLSFCSTYIAVLIPVFPCPSCPSAWPLSSCCTAQTATKHNVASTRVPCRSWWWCCRQAPQRRTLSRSRRANDETRRTKSKG